MNNVGRIERELMCGLTDEEVQSRGRMLGETVTAIDDTNSARTSAMKEFKERLVGLNEQQRKLARMIRDRSEWRMVVCLVQFHVPGEGMKRIVRMDTGEVVGEDKMTDGEKQMNLFAPQADFEEFMKRQMTGDTPTDQPNTDDSPGLA
jgi:hypothetical protein